MIRATLALVAVLLTSLPTVADEGSMPLVQAKGSPLKVSRVVRENDLFAEFKGSTWVKGSLVVAWYGADRSKAEYLLVPDRVSQKQLPHFARYPVRWIDISNGIEAFERSGGSLVAVRGNDEEEHFEKITGSFEITNYIVGVECDSPWARAVILRVDIPNQALIAGLNPPERC